MKPHSAQRIYVDKAVADAPKPGAATVQGQIDEAQSAVEAEQYSKALKILRPVIAGSSITSQTGQDARMLLIDALRADGNYRDALAETISLRKALEKADPKAAGQDGSSLSDLLVQEKVLQGQVERDDLLTRAVAGAGSPLRRSLAQADLLLFREKRDDAFALYVSTVNQALTTSSLGQEDVDPVNKGMFAAWWLRRHSPEFKGTKSQADKVVQDPQAPPFQRLLGLRVSALLSEPGSTWLVTLKIVKATEGQHKLQSLHDGAYNVAAKDASTVVAASLNASHIALNARHYDAADAALDEIKPIAAAFPETKGVLAGQLQAAREQRVWVSITKSINTALQMEIAGNRSAAADRYRQLADLCAASDAPHNNTVKQLGEEAARAVLVLQLPLEPSAKPGCRFLGLDKTIGSNWQNAVGTEAWVLFATHTKDFAGGPRVLDGSFTYRAINDDPANAVRRWRSPVGYQNNPKADTPLYDPVPAENEPVISFLDDNGEEYAYGAGPDMRLDISIPSGDHLLSIPLHFSDPGRADAHYSFTVLSRSGGAQHCIASTVVGVSDGAAYLRASISGPASYTLVVRRLDSLNANVPALFLDPLPRAGTLPLTTEFSAGELADAKIDPAAQGNANDHSAAGRLQFLAASYSQGDGDASALAAQAQGLIASPDLNDTQHAVAAFLAWRFLEDVPLAAGRRLPAFAQFVAPRYALISEKAYSIVPELMMERADGLRASNRYAYAEVVDDALWDMGLRRGTGDIADKGQALSKQMAMVQKLWSRGPEKYLKANKVLTTFGVNDKDTGVILLALDPVYAAWKARRGSQVLISGDNKLGMCAAPTSVPITVGPGICLFVARGWLDDLAVKEGVNPNGLASFFNQKPNDPLPQPVGAIVYSAAAAPFLEGSLSPSATPSSPSEQAQAGPLALSDPGMPIDAKKGKDPKSCLLRDLQLETLGRTYFGRGMSSSDEQAAINTDLGARTFSLIKILYPSYARMDGIDPVLKQLKDQKKQD